MDNRPIAVFDSGVGGLTSISAFKTLLPHEEIIYFGDTARAPYGSKSPDTIRSFSLQIADFLIKQNAKTLVAACNTVSSVALDEIKKEHPGIPVQGIIEPAAEEIASVCNSGNSIGIIGTVLTVRSRSYENALYALKGDLNVHSAACPAFVPLIEEGAIDSETMTEAIHHYLDRFIADNNIDTLVLACTHYPIIRSIIEKCFPALDIIDPSMALARAVKNQLTKNDMLGEKRKTEDIFCASDLSQDFINTMNRLNIKGDFTLRQHRF